MAATRGSLQHVWHVIHINLTPQCGICGTAIQPGAKFVALLGNDDSTGFARRSDELPFPQFDRMISTKQFQFCRWAKCRSRTKHAEAPAVHADCLDVFLERCRPPGTGEDEALRRLWLAAVWRTPWRDAPFFYLFESHALEPIHDGAILKRLGLPHMASLPSETVMAIQQQSAGSSLWRLNAAVGLAQALSGQEQPAKQAPVPLSELVSWERGGPLVLAKAGAKETAEPLPPIVRFTFDARGIRKIERLAARPAPESWRRTGRLAFAVCDEARQLPGVTVLFRLGHARLQLPPSTAAAASAKVTGLWLWDTPTPPPLGDVLFDKRASADLSQPALFTTVDLATTRGLTFLFSESSLHAVHAHTDEAPSAQATADRFAPHCAKPLVWHYVPLAGGTTLDRDRILDFGVRRNDRSVTMVETLALLIRTRLAGEFVLGQRLFNFGVDVVLAEAATGSPPSMLVFAMDGPRPITSIGAYAGYGQETRPGIDDKRLFASVFPSSSTAEDRDGRLGDEYYMSKAPLEKVTRVEVFHEPTTRRPRGAVLTYADGGQRSVGECRVGGAAPSRVYDAPDYVCYFTGCVEVYEIFELVATTEAEHRHVDHSNSDWTCCRLEGALEGLFNDERLHFDRIDLIDELFMYPDPPYEDSEESEVEYASYPSVME